MRWLSKWFHGGDELDRDIDEELRFHLEMGIERYLRAGLSPEEARRKALDRFGNFHRIREAVREIDLGLLGSVWQDVRYAGRDLRKNPAFASIAVLSLALGIGLNSVVFSGVHAVLWNPLPYREPDRIVSIWETNLKQRPSRYMPPANFLDLEKQSSAFESMAAIDLFNNDFVVFTGGDAERLGGYRVSANFFEVLGVAPQIGRTFLPEEERSAAPVTVISYRLWKDRFHLDPTILGREIRLNEAPHRVVGVLPEQFRYYMPSDYVVPGHLIDVWLPDPFEYFPRVLRKTGGVGVIARLKPGVGVPQAQEEMSIIARRLESEHPAEDKGVGVHVQPLLDDLAGNSRSMLWFGWATAGLVLLLTCVNLANLALSRAGARRREISIRSAMGASRSRLIRQLLTESVLLAIASGIAGLLLSIGSRSILLSLLPNSHDIQRLDEAGVSLAVVGFTLLIAIVTGLLFGCIPALQGSGTKPYEALRQGAHGSEGRRGNRLRGTLVALELALSLVLLAGAGLMVNTFWHLTHVPLGFRPDHLLTLRSRLVKKAPYIAALPGEKSAGARWALTEIGAQFPERAVAKLERLPGVESACAASGLPFLRHLGARFSLPDRPTPSPSEGRQMFATAWRITPGFLRTMGIRLRTGRTFSELDTPDTQPVVIVSLSLASAYWANPADAVGSLITVNQEPAPRQFQIIGIAEDVRLRPLQNRTDHQIYLALPQAVFASYPQGVIDRRLDYWFAVRTRTDPAALAPMVREAIRETDPDAPVDRIAPMEDAISESLGQWRSPMLLLTTLAVLALLLSAIGIYGVIAYSVAQRRHEIGVRIALGAGRARTVRLVIAGAMLPALAGVAGGVAASYLATRYIAYMLYGVTPADPMTLACVVIVLLAVALLACYIPARRAARTDPIVALRCD